MWPPFLRAHGGDYEARRDARGTHALVIGVSSYPVLRNPSEWNLKELQSAAISAVVFAEWLNLVFRTASSSPLRSLRVLLSPSPLETDVLGERLGEAPPATSANVNEAVKAWQADCAAIPGNTAVLFTCGHGVFADEVGHNLLLEDLERELSLRSSLDLASVKTGLGYLGVEASYVFVDACQVPLTEDVMFGGGIVMHARRAGKRERRVGAYAFESAVRGTLAYGIKGETSLFTRRLLDVLNADGVERDVEGRWTVSAYSLAKKLSGWSQIGAKKQRSWPGAQGADLPFHAPPAPVSRISVQLDPENDREQFHVRITDGRWAPEHPVTPFRPHPFEVEVKPGVHIVELVRQSELQCEPPSISDVADPFKTMRADFRTRSNND